MSEHILGIISAMKRDGFTKQTFEELCFTTQRVIVVRTGKASIWWGSLGAIQQWHQAKQKAKELANLSPSLQPDELLKADLDNFAIPNPEIKKIQLKKFGRGATIKIDTGLAEYKWFVRGIPGKEQTTIEDCKRILQTALPEKLET